MSSFDISEFLGVFIDEVDEQLGIIDQEVLALEQEGESPEVVQRIFRAAHTLKGSSATMGFEDMTKLTHAMENLLDQVRNGHLEVSGELVNLLFKCLDELRVLKDEIVDEQEERTDITPLVQEVQAFPGEGQPAKTISETQDDSSPADQKENAVFSPADEDIQELAEQGMDIYEITLTISDECEMKSVRAFIINNQLEDYGEIIQAVPDLNQVGQEEEPDYKELHFLFATQYKEKELEDFVQSMTDVDKSELQPVQAGKQPKPATDNVKLEESQTRSHEDADANEEEPKSSTSSDPDSQKTNVEHSANEPAAEREKKTGKPATKKQSQTIRVDVNRLEHLMNLVGELVIDQTRISQVGTLLNNRYSGDETIDELDHVSDHIARVIGELQESVMKVRMLPIGQLFSRFPRMVRDLAQSLHKDIDLVIEGQDTELDRTVIEKIGDPLIHLIRNAVDHGLESAEERLEKGKSAKGCLRITAAHEENQVVITVEDDGAGISPEKMRSSAVKKGIITQEEADKLTDEEAAHLIFRPGFSTAASVSDVSGRGVGMDIVRNHIESLNGIIDLDTKVGRGSIFKIKLPLTLAIITGLIVRLGDSNFILPMSNVIEIVRIKSDSIQTIKGKSIVVVREQVLPVVWLHDLLQVPRESTKNRHLPVVIVGVGEKKLALVVDELQGNQEIVVKSLGKYVGKINGISGATILGDGRVELILEVAGINRMTNSI